ncbi:Optic atrophy 3 protein (OPA3) family protein [Clavispora lusitaniae]|uniref:Optic atrophy 3 protein (OPA3) family protein n=1 Tax=Clavispora lusitaniae TaxID=36911 RepID=UPI00202C3D80|nr:Optic atrophy 3 protein (OPA3) family protein [Clavispora lusitaniae]
MQAKLATEGHAASIYIKPPANNQVKRSCHYPFNVSKTVIPQFAQFRAQSTPSDFLSHPALFWHIFPHWIRCFVYSIPPFALLAFCFHLVLSSMSGIALKLTSLLVRTVAKPIALTLKAQAKEHEAFRNACIRVAQTVHSTDVKLRMRLLGENRIKVRPLNDKKAIENGANFLSEFFIFSVAGSLIFYESYRARVKSQNEKLTVKNDIIDLQEEITTIKDLVEKLCVDLERLQQDAEKIVQPKEK